MGSVTNFGPRSHSVGRVGSWGGRPGDEKRGGREITSPHPGCPRTLSTIQTHGYSGGALLIMPDGRGRIDPYSAVVVWLLHLRMIERDTG